MLLLVAIFYCPCMSADRRTTSLSSTGYHVNTIGSLETFLTLILFFCFFLYWKKDPYKFAYAIKKPLPFHASFGQSLSVESTTADVYSKRTPRKKPEAQQEEDISLDESSFGDRIVPRAPTGRQVPKKTTKQQPVADNQPSKSDEKQEELNQKLIDSFFSTFSVPTPVPDRPKEFPTVKTTPKYEEPEIVERPKENPRKRIKAPVKTIETDNSGHRDYAESIQNQFISLPSSYKSNQELEVEHKGIEEPSIVNAETNTPIGLEYSYFVFGSSSTPEQFADKLRDNPLPSVEDELAGKDVGSPGIVSSSIDDLYNKFSPFSPEGFGRPSVSSPPSITENTAERPFVAPQEVKSQFSSDIAPFVQSVSTELPPFIPSPQVNNFPRYPIPPQAVRDFSPSTSESIEPFPKPRFPEPNKFAGFFPSGAGGDTFTQFPKPNFAAFHPPPSTETVYYGGQPNEPPAHPILQNNVISFIKSNVAPENALRPSSFPQYPGTNNNFGGPPAIQNIQNNFAELQNVRLPPPPLNVQPFRPPPQANTVGPTAPKINFPPAPPRPASAGQAKPAGFNPNLASLPPSSTISGQSITGVKQWSDPAPVRVLTAPKPSAPAVNPPSSPLVKPFIASQQLSTRPLSVPAAPQVIRPQRFNQQLPPNSVTAQPPKPGPTQNFAGFADFKPPNRNPLTQLLSSIKPTRSAAPAAAPRPPQHPSGFSPQINQVLPALTRNPAPIPILAPQPVYLTSHALTLPKPASARQVPNSYSVPLAKPIYYHAFVTYG